MRRAADTAGHRAAVSHQRRTLASRRAGARSVLHRASGAWGGSISHAAGRAVPVRGRLSSRWRRHGYRGSQRRAHAHSRGGLTMLSESEPHYRQPLLKTPFHERARALSQVDSFIPWAGYTTVDVFSFVEQEYFAIRNATSLYDLTPMVKYQIAGRDALRFLNRLIASDIGKRQCGRVANSVWCNDVWHLIDDATVFRLGDTEYRLCAGERQLDWLLDSGLGFDVQISEVTEETAALAVQGPTSCAVLRAFGLSGIERLKPFEIAYFTLPPAIGADSQIMVSRTGFTGDLGYELWMRPEDAESVWDALMEEGRNRAIRPIGSPAAAAE